MLQVLQVELLVANEGEDTAGCADDDVRCRGLERLLILLDRHAAEENSNFDARHVLAESLVLLADLERQLASVAHDQNVDLVVGRFQLLKSGQNEYGRLAHTRLGLAQDVHAQNGLWNALVLDWKDEKSFKKYSKVQGDHHCIVV